MIRMLWKSVAPGLRVSERYEQGVAHVRLAGELDLATAPVALRVLLDAAARSHTVVLNLACVTFLDAFAVGRLVEAKTAISARGGALVLWRLHPAARRVLDLADLGAQLEAANETPAGPRTPTAKIVAILDETIDAALRLSGADMGNAQLLHATDRSLRIVTHRGFSPAFLDFFDVVEDADSACGTALAQCRSVWVSDVTRSRIFVGTPALDVLLNARARSVASIPVQRPGGELVAMFSVHRRQTGHWTAQQRRALETIGRNAGQQLTPT